MNDRAYDVICVGGGVAGAATAAGLAACGRRVLLLEQNTAPRDKACGEGLLPHGTAVLKGLLNGPVEGTPTRGVRFHLGGAGVEVPFPHHGGLALRRSRLDEALRSAAVSRGAVLRQARVHAVEPGAVVTSAGRFLAPVVVGADGVHSGFHRSQGCRVQSARERVGFSTHLADYVPDPHWVEVHCFSGGEFYVAPVEPGVTLVAVLVSAGLGLRSREVVEFIRTRLPGAEHARPAGPVLARAPLATTIRPLAGHGWLLVGDAAGAVDPITGEGMSLALTGAQRAVAAVDGYLRGDARALLRYAEETAAHHRALSRLTRAVLFAARHPRVGRAVLAWSPAHRTLMRAAVASGVEDLPAVARVLARGAA